MLEAPLVLRRDDKDRITARVKDLRTGENSASRPGFPNAGSMFKNPQEESAGRLIEQAGLKGKRRRSAGFREARQLHREPGQGNGGGRAALMEIVSRRCSTCTACGSSRR